MLLINMFFFILFFTGYPGIEEPSPRGASIHPHPPHEKVVTCSINQNLFKFSKLIEPLYRKRITKVVQEDRTDLDMGMTAYLA